MIDHQPLKMKVMILHLFFFVGLAEDEIHCDDEPRDHDRDKEDGVVLRLLLELVYELKQQVAVVNDLCEHDHFIGHQEG